MKYVIRLKRTKKFSVLLILFAVMLLIVAHAEAQETPANELFSDVFVTYESFNAKAGDPTIIQSHSVTVNFENLVGKSLPTGAERIKLNLFSDLSLIAVKNSIQKRSASQYTWFGKIEGIQNSSAIIVVDNGSMAANITVEGKIYQVRAVGGGVHAIYEIDQSAFIDEGPPESVEVPLITEEYFPSLQDNENGCTTIDVMVVYTDDVASASANIDTEIQLAIDETNQSYINSNINHRLRLVHSVEVDYEESGDNTDLSRIVNTSDGHLDDVHTWRNTYGADVVSLWVESLDACGWGRFMSTVSSAFESEAFSLVERGCATGYYSFGHEIGHNMSAHHDCYVETSTAPYDYIHGYVNFDDRWRTIMAYNNECDCSDEVTPCPASEDRATPGTPSCTRLQYWSNPNVTYGGDAMGLATGSCTSDNSQVLNNTASTVAGFRATVVNNPPISESGGSYSAECQGATTTLALDGTASSDPDPCDSITYSWSTDCPGGSFDDSTSSTPVLSVDSSTQSVGCTAILTVTDTNGATDTDSASVTITDTTRPDITCPSDRTIECDEPTDPSNTGSASATDMCDSSPTITFTDIDTPGTCSDESTITRTWTATDASGNSRSCVQTIEVVDTTPPEIQCNAPATITPPDAPISFTATATDNCAGDPSVEIIGYDCFFVTRNEKIIDKTESCIVEVNGDTVTIVDSGGVGDNITWTVRANDNCGNVEESTCSVMVVLPDQP